MYARVASFEGGDLERIRELNEERRGQEDGLPPGVKRVLVLEQDGGGGRLFVTFFDSKDELDAASQTFEQMGDEIPEDVRGRRTRVDVYEVVVDEAR